MAQELLVNKWIEDGWSLAIRFHREISRVENLFWAHSTEAKKWYLFLMTAAVDEKGIGAAYSDLLATYDKMPHMAFSKFDLKLVRPKDEIGVWLRFQHHLVNTPANFSEPALVNTYCTLPGPEMAGTELIDAIYIYGPMPQVTSSANPMTGDEIKKKMFDLLSRAGFVPPSMVVLRDGSSFQGVAFGMEVSNGLMNAKFIDETSHLPKVIPIDQVASIT
jgi:hypothetical protein